MTPLELIKAFVAANESWNKDELANLNGAIHAEKMDKLYVQMQDMALIEEPQPMADETFIMFECECGIAYFRSVDSAIQNGNPFCPSCDDVMGMKSKELFERNSIEEKDGEII